MKSLTFIFLSTFILFSSCRKFKQEEVVAKAEPFKPTNIYPVERLPLNFTRVVLLPCFHNDPDNSILKFCDQVFFQELAQERIFEIIQLSTENLQSLVGQKRLSSTGRLPANFLKIIEDYTGANGVLFIDLDSYKPFRPMTLGLGLNLLI